MKRKGENFTVLQKADVKVEICMGNKDHDFFLFFFNSVISQGKKMFSGS